MPDAPLKELLATIGMNGERLAGRVNALAETLRLPQRVHPKTPYKWIQGQTPKPPLRSLVVQVLSQELGRTITVEEMGWPPDEPDTVPAAAGLQTPWTAAGTLRALRAVTHAGLMDRRHFMMLMGTALTAPAHEWLIAHPAQAAARAAGSKVPISVVDDLDHITDRLRRMDDQIGGGQLLSLIHEHLRYVTTLLDEHSYTATVGRRLHATAGELLRLAGFAAFDDNQHAHAQRYWIAGLHAAHTAGDRALGANILGFMSCQAKDLDGGREAVILAETARSAYPGASPKVRAILALRAAEASANDQTATATRRAATTNRAIDAAFDALADQPTSTGDPGWSYWMNLSQAHAQAGYCHMKIGDYRQARFHLRRALKLQGSTYSRERALRKFLLATTYIKQQQPDLDAALAQANEGVAILSSEVNSARCLGHLRRFADALTPFRRSAPAKDFLAQSRALINSRP